MKAKTITYTATFLALSVVGSMIKPFSMTVIFSTVALDSFAALVAGYAFGIFYGGFVAAFGHLFSAYLSGFPLTLPFHLLISFEMFVSVFIYSLLRKKSKYFACVIFIIFNGIISVVPFIWLLSFKFAIGIVVPLLLASVLNVLIAEKIISKLFIKEKKLNEKLSKEDNA
ncbi:MAG: ECF transporter S component [Fusobacteriaceae bacterium]